MMERFQKQTYAAKEAVPLAPRGSHLEGAFDSRAYSWAKTLPFILKAIFDLVTNSLPELERQRHRCPHEMHKEDANVAIWDCCCCYWN